VTSKCFVYVSVDGILTSEFAQNLQLQGILVGVDTETELESRGGALLEATEPKDVLFPWTF